MRESWKRRKKVKKKKSAAVVRRWRRGPAYLTKNRKSQGWEEEGLKRSRRGRLVQERAAADREAEQQAALLLADQERCRQLLAGQKK